MSYPRGSGPRQVAAYEALQQYKQVSTERKRGRIFAYPHGSSQGQDVTEDVVSVLDQITQTLDWGSGFFDDDELLSFFRLADLLKLDIPVTLQAEAEAARKAIG